MKILYAEICVFVGVLLQMSIRYSYGLDCFSCNGVSRKDDCHDVKQCLPHQICYTESRVDTSGRELFTMGCRTNEFCQGIPSVPVGRAADPTPSMTGCLQCCSLHGCNKYLCPLQAITRTTTAGQCKDLIDCSDYYPQEACFVIYKAWSTRYCPVHCGYCPTPSPVPCVDTIANCHEFQADMCDNLAFVQWRESHCRKFCKLC